MRSGHRLGNGTGGATLLVGLAFIVGLAWGASRGVSDAGQSPVPVPAPPEAVVPPGRETARMFTSDQGLIFNFLKPGQNAAFEGTMKRVMQALATSPNNDRRRQGLGWQLYKADDPLDGGVLLYISILDPTVPGMDYWVPKILNEAYPTEVQDLYSTYADLFSDGQMLQNLTLVYGE